MNSLSLVINSHSSNSDCLSLFFKQLEKYTDTGALPKTYLFIDEIDLDSLPSYVKCIKYDSKQCFTDQMIDCLSQVEEEFILYLNEDYLFYKEPNLEFLNDCLGLLSSSDLSYIRFVYTDIESFAIFSTILSNKIFYIPPTSQCSFSQALSLWKTKDYLKIHEVGPKAAIGIRGNTEGHFEILAKETCKDLNIQGAVVYGEEQKRGIFHYDSDPLPHIASALIKGKWNVSEYPELQQILDNNNIDTSTRGTI